jgi:oxygen-independent coproporphyrinogen III oxidase
MAGIYIHIPFCKQACHYCDFHFSTNVSGRSSMVEVIVRELQMQKAYLDVPVQTVYFGGGTPSIIPAEELEKILEAVSAHYQLTSEPEITLEANPDDLSREKLKALKQIGINRLSIGIQSFSDKILKYFNRPHSSAEGRESMRFAREAGFTNISIDLIYAVPDQAKEDWLQSIRQAIDLQPEHISAYGLTIEPATPFGIWHKRGKLKPVEDDTAAEQFEVLVDELSVAGYDQYEVSNFSRAGFHSRHNSSYWKQEHYLGVGPSAHSYNGVSRQFNVRNNALYIKGIEEGRVPFEFDALTVEDHVNEYLLTTLRTTWGCDLTFLKEAYQYDLANIQKEYLDLLILRGHAVMDGHFLKLTKSGRLLADQISSDLFIEKRPRVS